MQKASEDGWSGCRLTAPESALTCVLSSCPSPQLPGEADRPIFSAQTELWGVYPVHLRNQPDSLLLRATNYNLTVPVLKSLEFNMAVHP